MEYYRDKKNHLILEPDGNPFDSKTKRKLSARSYSIRFENKRKFLSRTACVSSSLVLAENILVR